MQRVLEQGNLWKGLTAFEKSVKSPSFREIVSVSGSAQRLSLSARPMRLSRRSFQPGSWQETWKYVRSESCNSLSSFPCHQSFESFTEFTVFEQFKIKGRSTVGLWWPALMILKAPFHLLRPASACGNTFLCCKGPKVSSWPSNQKNSRCLKSCHVQLQGCWPPGWDHWTHCSILGKTSTKNKTMNWSACNA